MDGRGREGDGVVGLYRRRDGLDRDDGEWKVLKDVGVVE